MIDTVVFVHSKEEGNGTGRLLKALGSRGSARSNKKHSYLITGQRIRIQMGGSAG